MWNSSHELRLADGRLTEMTTKLTEINSAAFDSQFTIQTRIAEATDLDGLKRSEQNANIKVAFSGVQDVRDINNPKAMMSVEASFDGEIASQDIPGGAVKLELRMLGDIVFIRLLSAPEIPFFDLKPFIGIWIRIDPMEIAQQFGITEADIAAAEGEDDISQEEAERLSKLWQEADVLKVVSVKSGEMIDGVDTYHYVIEIQKPQLIAYLKKVAVELAEDVPAEDIATMEKNINEIDLPQGEIWVGKSDLYLRRLRVAHTVEATDVSPADTTLFFEFSLSKINEPVLVTAPIGARSLEEVVEEVFSAMSEASLDDSGDYSSSDSFYSPAQQFAKARDTQRSANVNALLNAIGQNKADNRGIFTCSAGPLPSTAKLMSSFEYDIAPCLVPEYLYTMVTDPGSESYWKGFENYEAGYLVEMNAQTGRVTVSAPFAETGEISVSR